MIGRLIDVRKMYKGKFTVLTIQEHESKLVLHVSIDTTDQDYSKYLKKMISVNTTVTALANSNMEHEYPEGTIGG